MKTCEPGQHGTNPVGTELAVVDGNVQLDSTASIRGTLDLTTDGRGWQPQPANSKLMPYGTEIHAARGLIVNGAPEYVSLGYYRIAGVDQDDAPDGQLRISGQDRSSVLADAKLLEATQFRAGSTVYHIFNRLVRDVLPGQEIEFDYLAGTDQLTRQLVLGGSGGSNDRWAFLSDLATSRGKYAYFDYRGVLVVKSPPDADDPVWEANAGEDGVLVSAGRSVDRSGLYNAVVVTGQGADTENPVRAVAFDADPDSPTYWQGDFGQVPRFESSSTVGTVQQASLAAQTILQRSIGLPLSVDFTAVPNPALETLDPVRLVYPRGGGSRTHVMQQVTVPLTADGTLSGTAKHQAAASVFGVLSDYYKDESDTDDDEKSGDNEKK
ncbi:MAG: DUF5047 domain-containing protein [Streptosporangiales bacterium]